VSVPINRGTDGLSQRVYALIFNGITQSSSSATDERDWIRLSERERIAAAVYAELRAGNIEFRMGGLALLAEVSEFEEFRDKLAALAAIEDYIGESGQNAARNVRDLLAGRGDDGNDPRVQARKWGLEW
jgi:hypothetical protein